MKSREVWRTSMNNLRKYRRSCGLTQSALAEASIISRTLISHMEINRCKPSPTSAKSVCDVFTTYLGRPVRLWEVFPEDFEEL